MTISIDRARNFVYANGLLWEQALFSYLFDGGSLNRLHECLRCYKNSDGGWGHGLEHDVKCPESHPLALEFLMSISRDTNIPMGNLLDGTLDWVERDRNEDGSLRNPETLLKYPHAPWWNDGGQTAPDSITGNLLKNGISSDSLMTSTTRWTRSNLTIEKIQNNEWLFMAYHAFDYYMNLEESLTSKPLKEATIHNIIGCAGKAEQKKYFTFFQFANSPETEIAQAVPQDLLKKFLDYLESSQREDGGWDDEHGLKHWQPYMTTFIVLVLKNYGRLN